MRYTKSLANGMIKIIHYRRKCIGCAICQELQPALWRMSKKDGKATLLKAVVKKEIHMVDISLLEEEECRAIAEACPARVIKVM